MRKTKTCRNACSELSVILKLCSGIIVLEAAAMLHDSDAEFTIIDSVHKAKSRRKYQIVFKKSTAIRVFRYQFFKKPMVLVTVLKKYRGTLASTRHCPPLHFSLDFEFCAHLLSTNMDS